MPLMIPCTYGPATVNAQKDRAQHARPLQQEIPHDSRFDGCLAHVFACSSIRFILLLMIAAAYNSEKYNYRETYSELHKFQHLVDMGQIWPACLKAHKKVSRFCALITQGKLSVVSTLSCVPCGLTTIL